MLKIALECSIVPISKKPSVSDDASVRKLINSAAIRMTYVRHWQDPLKSRHSI